MWLKQGPGLLLLGSYYFWPYANLYLGHGFLTISKASLFQSQIYTQSQNFYSILSPGIFWWKKSQFSIAECYLFRRWQGTNGIFRCFSPSKLMRCWWRWESVCLIGQKFFGFSMVHFNEVIGKGFCSGISFLKLAVNSPEQGPVPQNFSKLSNSQVTPF